MSQRRNGRLKNGRLKKRLEIGRHLVRDPEIYHGELTFKGTRVPVRVVLAYAANGMSLSRIRRNWPEVSEEAVMEALNLAKEALVEKHQQAT
ncbi:MAG: DUF433 domain-containing protein [candidate division KSB1 bacterium]|nr:DUF433 domain-containing protein [candidate division KSB1 bacterium]MDZ7369148.1 DUF433 domain-containing protein [candidate division KSB1 bacterium]MDZ7407089.1 DUF433 domain-containing protein [candidate division KSB1 bacterium]